ncbi:cell division protein ZapA [Amaricoccus solimangrovi]|uniref:Cell division protein ZapA n=1 Tax=Amaricoccus solimangrovi TaxID=2589815 RepID=A0A501WGJ2_9RHOB|nr:cell division protein ZapA [Amaricoccus solimangrovi]TPE48508.1 cell division protein ZapA [Amaricoccus solimangrovi]
MPELLLEIGGRMFEVACEPGQENSLHRAARLLDTEATKVETAIGRQPEKRTLLLAGLMLADTTSSLEDRLAATEDRLRSAEERVRIAEAKSAMLAANALKMETEATHRISAADIEKLREENEGAVLALTRVLQEVNELAARVESGE